MQDPSSIDRVRGNSQKRFGYLVEEKILRYEI